MDSPDSPVRARIAPSPTGRLHVGTARAALFNELFARHHQGSFILRLEDTDPARSRPEFEESIIEGLRWLGLRWDEGPDVGGAYGPYRQSERGAGYQKALHALLESDQAYCCFCPVGEERSGCTCRALPWSTAQERAKTEHCAVKLRVGPQEVAFEDLIRGMVRVQTDSFGGDFTIARSLTEPLFHLAVVVDDAAMAITHVIRGEDHISNTPKHILLQRALNYPQPLYAHLPLLLDESRRKLSKRAGEVELLHYRDQGYLPEAMMNYLALLGWHPKDDREIFSHEELMEAFSLEDAQKGGAIFSLEKLQAVNKHYIRQLTPAALLERSQPYLAAAGVDTSDTARLTAALATEQERVATLAELPTAISFFLPDWPANYAPTLLVWQRSTREAAVERLEKLDAFTTDLPPAVFTATELQARFLAWIDGEDFGRGETLWPLRVALCGQEHSPGSFEIMAALGKEESLRRIRLAQAKLT